MLGEGEGNFGGAGAIHMNAHTNTNKSDRKSWLPSHLFCVMSGISLDNFLMDFIEDVDYFLGVYDSITLNETSGWVDF